LDSTGSGKDIWQESVNVIIKIWVLWNPGDFFVQLRITMIHGADCLLIIYCTLRPNWNCGHSERSDYSYTPVIHWPLLYSSTLTVSMELLGYTAHLDEDKRGY
jgi:hypothetical protein